MFEISNHDFMVYLILEIPQWLRVFFSAQSQYDNKLKVHVSFHFFSLILLLITFFWAISSFSLVGNVQTARVGMFWRDAQTNLDSEVWEYRARLRGIPHGSFERDEPTSDTCYSTSAAATTLEFRPKFQPRSQLSTSSRFTMMYNQIRGSRCNTSDFFICVLGYNVCNIYCRSSKRSFAIFFVFKFS